MAVYAIGDVQGCLIELQKLLEILEFDSRRDRLWLVGDLVNRGDHSLETLRYVKSLGSAAVTVLGNHDLHTLAVYHGAQALKRKDTLDELLQASDADELLTWLRQRPLLHHDAELGYTLVHAGLAPQWSLEDARLLAAEVQGVLGGDQYMSFLTAMYGDDPDLWSDDLQGMERLRYITNALTRIRYCREDGSLELKTKGAPGDQPQGLTEWFRFPGRRSAGRRLVFGHWSTLGVLHTNHCIALDTGCVWGGRLTAVRLDDGSESFTAIDCQGALSPGG